MQPSDRHSGAIKREHILPAGGENGSQTHILQSINRNHVRPAGGGRTQQSDRHSTGIKRYHARSAGGGENPVVRSAFCRHQKRPHTFCRRGERNSQIVNMMFRDNCRG